MVSLRAVITETGITASAAAAAIPAGLPNTRRTRSYISGTATVAASAWGKISDVALQPNSFVLAT